LHEKGGGNEAPRMSEEGFLTGDSEAWGFHGKEAEKVGRALKEACEDKSMKFGDNFI
jgi:hypothetical protein